MKATSGVVDCPRRINFWSLFLAQPLVQSKPNTPPTQNYSRMSNAELYAEAYPDRGMYEPPRRPYGHNKV